MTYVYCNKCDKKMMLGELNDLEREEHDSNDCGSFVCSDCINNEMELDTDVFNDMVKLYDKYCNEIGSCSEEEFMEQVVLYLVEIMKRKQEMTKQYKNKPNVLLEGFYKFIELRD